VAHSLRRANGGLLEPPQFLDVRTR